MTTLCGSEQLMGSLPEVKWAQQVRSLSAELQEESLRLIVQHLPQVIHTQAFHDLCRVSQLHWGNSNQPTPEVTHCVIASSMQQESHVLISDNQFSPVLQLLFEVVPKRL